ncbi:uncharacterized protein LOC129949244 [Eupeodes corollae]|uniref:uncharacterized protein LOC129949244 n=1 Tax=Eupeodes corollae TaxID=290404 RepID=UPI00249126DF|nr:uncharacterized protein LOC129949244 [Eupeodes corollae]
MIIVVLLFFQSLCLYLQNIVLKVHDKWLNPKHARILIDKEQRRLQLLALKPKHPVPGCSFCSNSPLGYCRHHSPNQPTLRHLKNRLLAKGGSTSSISTSTAIGEGGDSGDISPGESVASGGGTGSGEQQQLHSVEGSSSVLSTPSTSSSSLPSPSSACEALANYFDSRDPDKICTCLSCTHGGGRNASSHGRRNRTSWGTRNGTVIWGERVVPAIIKDENGLEIAPTKKRRQRRYEKYGGFY